MSRSPFLALPVNNNIIWSLITAPQISISPSTQPITIFCDQYHHHHLIPQNQSRAFYCPAVATSNMRMVTLFSMSRKYILPWPVSLSKRYKNYPFFENIPHQLDFKVCSPGFLSLWFWNPKEYSERTKHFRNMVSH